MKCKVYSRSTKHHLSTSIITMLCKDTRRSQETWTKICTSWTRWNGQSRLGQARISFLTSSLQKRCRWFFEPCNEKRWSWEARNKKEKIKTPSSMRRLTLKFGREAWSESWSLQSKNNMKNCKRGNSNETHLQTPNNEKSSKPQQSSRPTIYKTSWINWKSLRRWRWRTRGLQDDSMCMNWCLLILKTCLNSFRSLLMMRNTH
jgi:hypothetical protein